MGYKHTYQPEGSDGGRSLPVQSVLVALGLLAVGFAAGGLAWRWAGACCAAIPPVSPHLARLACGLMWAGLGLVYGPHLETVELCLLALVLVALSLTDLASLTIPNACIVAAVLVRVPYIAFAGLLGKADPAALLVRSLAGGLGTLVSLLVLTVILDRLLGTESLGGGDLKLLAVAGMYVGWMAVPMLALACLLGLAGAFVKAHGRPDALEPFAFGPAIACSLWVALMVAPLSAGFVRWMF